jgi:Uma2 family endonuclease
VISSEFPGAHPTPEVEPRVVLHDVPWSTYVVLRDTTDSSGVHMTYLEGQLEIRSPSRTHEVSKKQIARLLELFCLERGIPLYGYGSTTFRKEEKRGGLEPDECYCRARDGEVPDLALEVVVSAPAIDKLDVYRRLGIREIWLFSVGSFQVFVLQDEEYEPRRTSELFPELDLERLAHYAGEADQHAALQAYRAEIRGN